MGFLRGSAFVIVSVLLFLSLIGAGFFYSVSMSLDYDVLKSELISNADSTIRDLGVYDSFVENFPLMQAGCITMNSYNFTIESMDFEISCEVIEKGVDEVYYYSLGEFVMSSYYTEYDCSLLKCLEETKSPGFLISEKTRNYAVGKLSFLIFVILILSGLMFLLSENRTTLPIIVGVFFTLVSLIFMKLDSFLVFIDDKVILGFVAIFFTGAYSVFLRFLFFGGLFIIVGVVLKLFLIGFKIHGIVKWFKEKFRKSNIKKLEERINKNKKILSKKNISKDKKGESIIEKF